MNLEKICLEVTQLTATVGKFIQEQALLFDIDKNVESKGSNELVSYVDKTAEEMLVKTLGSILPEAGFITEEGTISKSNSELCWIVDPLDGTTNFMHRLPLYAISIALKLGNEIVLGVVHELNRDECFYAWKDGGAYLNKKKISIAKTKQIKDALIVTGFPYSMDTRANQYMNIVRDIQLASHGVRRLGSAATDMAYVACGRLDAYFEFNVKIWDIAGGFCILAEAGGQTTNFSGSFDVHKIEGIEIIAAGKIHDEMLSIVQKHWNNA